MRCPTCGTVPEQGDVAVRGSIFGFLVVGLSYMCLWWYPKEGRRERLLRSGAKYSAFRCMNCGTVVIPAE